jgi:hypothetical protein
MSKFEKARDRIEERALDGLSVDGFALHRLTSNGIVEQFGYRELFDPKALQSRLFKVVTTERNDNRDI